MTLLGCLGCRDQPAPARLKVGLVNLHSYGLVFVAQDHRFLDDEGVVLELVTFQAGRDALHQVSLGKLDLATVYSTPVVIRSLEGAELSAITRLHGSIGLHAIVGRGNARIRTAADLRGRRLGITPRTSSEGFVRLFLATNAVRLDEVQLMEANPTQLEEMLAAGTLDAASFWHPRVWSAQERLTSASTLLTSDVYTEISMLVGTRRRVDELAPTLERLLRALNRAEALVDEQPGVVAASLRRRLPDLPEERLQFLLDHVRFELGISNLMLTALEQEATFFRPVGDERPVPEMRGVLRPELLQKVAPHSVTLSSGQRPGGPAP